MPDVPTEFPDPREHRRIIARAINEALDRVGASADDVPIDFPNPTEHRRIMATAVNEQLQELQLDSIKVRFDYDREHRRIIAAAVNLLFKAIEDEPPPVGATLETTSVISAASTITSESNVSSTPNPTGTFFDTGLRRLHCSQLGNPPLDGTTPDLTFTNLQTALNAVIAGDVLTVAAETFTGSFSLNNAAGTEDEPIWITAEVRGETIISNLIQSVKNGTQTWTSDGAGIFSISGSRPYIGSDLSNGEFLPGYVQVSDINAPTIPTDTGPNNPSGSINKPQRGFAFSGGRIRLKVTGGSNPTGRPIALTQGFDFQQMSWNNADNC
ncbi:MAG: hypothetical protein ACR2RE_09805, partial [Geminicoccaceae bacterium]